MSKKWEAVQNVGAFYVGRKSLEPAKRYEHLAGIQAKETPASETNHDSKKQGRDIQHDPEIELAYRDLLNATSI